MKPGRAPGFAAGYEGEAGALWAMIAAMEYMIVELRDLSPMSAHLLRMARQNLVDEFFSGEPADD